MWGLFCEGIDHIAVRPASVPDGIDRCLQSGAEKCAELPKLPAEKCIPSRTTLNANDSQVIDEPELKTIGGELDSSAKYIYAY